MFDPELLSGRTALITGGGQGLGRATATALHNAGASVVVTWVADETGVNQQRAEQTVADPVIVSALGGGL